MLLLLFSVGVISSSVSQVDSTSRLDDVYRTSPGSTGKVLMKKFGCSIFGGLGKGGNRFYDGFSFGGSFRTHYRIHTINIYSSLATRRKELYSKDYTNLLYSSNYGIVYGPGFHDKNFSVSCGAGIGYFWTTVDMWPINGAINTSGPDYITYKQTSLCLGAQLGVHSNRIGLSAQFFYNSNKSLTNYTGLLGIEVILW